MELQYTSLDIMSDIAYTIMTRVQLVLGKREDYQTCHVELSTAYSLETIEATHSHVNVLLRQGTS